jgi:hypothetical protein
VDGLIGLAEVYVDMADKRTVDRDAGARVDLYTRAIDLLSTAITLVETKSPDRPITTVASPSSAYYLRGYARVQLWETRWLRRDNRLVRDARKDFQKCLEADSNHTKAARAAERIQEEVSRQRSILDRLVSPGVVVLAVVLFLLAQFGLVVGFPTESHRLALTEQSLAALRAAGVKEETLAALKPLEEVPFRGEETLLARVKAVLDDKKFEPLKGALVLHAAQTDPVREWVRIDLGTYALLTFGSLVFMIAGAYLPELTSLKLAAVQLEKSTADRVETVRSLGISK